MSVVLKKFVRKFGARGAHITLHRKYIGKEVKVSVPRETIEEITKRL